MQTRTLPQGLTKEKLIEMYRTMVRIRRFEEKVSEIFYTGQIPGHVHLYIGQEATGVGVISNLLREDKITSTHRGHGHTIAKGADPKRVMAELFGKRTGYNKGKGGSMHVADFSVGMLGACGIVAGAVPMATGAALAFQLRGEDNVVVSFLGDGAINEGAFHEAVNLGGLWKLPIVYVCENNGYATATPVSQATAAKTFADRGPGYGIPGVVVDGMDILAVYEAAHEAIERARHGEGPTLLECKTYRYHGHFEGESAILGKRLYRTQEEIDQWRRRDPILTFGDLLKDLSIMTADLAEQINAEARAEIDEAVKFAQESPFPNPEQALEDVFA